MSNRDEEQRNRCSRRTRAGAAWKPGESASSCRTPCGGFYALREQMTREIGPDFTADILYRAGCLRGGAPDGLCRSCNGSATEGRPLWNRALALLTEAGYGRLQLRDEAQKRPGEVIIRVENSLEGEMMRGPGRAVRVRLRLPARPAARHRPGICRPRKAFPTARWSASRSSCLAQRRRRTAGSSSPRRSIWRSMATGRGHRPQFRPRNAAAAQPAAGRRPGSDQARPADRPVQPRPL